MDLFQELDELDIKSAEPYRELRNHIMSSDKPYQDSLLFLPKEQKKVLDKGERQSQFRTFTDDKLFELADKLVRTISSDLVLVRNDLTQIRYESGGFFKPHKDYLSLTTNHLKEMTMIICLDANCEGGETCFYFNPNFKYKSNNTVTPGSAVIFRKDLVHEGCPIKNGYKNILTLNLWHVTKTSDTLVVVTTKDGKQYVLEQKHWSKSNYINSTVHFSDSQSETQVCQITVDESAEQFEVIYRVLTDQRISEEQFHRAEDRISLYIDDLRYVLVCPELDETDGTIKDVTYDAITLFDTEAHRDFKLKLHKDFSHDSYLPFSVFVAEGHYAYSSHEDTTNWEFPLTIFRVSIDDHLVYIRYLLREHLSETGLYTNGLVSLEHNPGIVGDSTASILQDLSIWELNLEDDDDKENPYYTKDCTCNSVAEEKEDHVVYHHKDTCPLYKYELYGEYIMQKLKSILPTLKLNFTFPQEENNVDYSFCNESAYGNMNSINISGVINVNEVLKEKAN